MGLFRRPKFLLAIGLVIVSLIVSHTILRFPFPFISIKPENLGKELIPLGPIGDFNLTNTIFSSWVAIAIIFILAYFTTRKLGLVPRGLQNFVEAVLSWLLGLVDSIAGPKGRRFFPLVATIFIFVIVNNWMSLLPGFATVGKIESAEEVVHHVIEEKAEEAEPHLTLVEAEHELEIFLEWDEAERIAAPTEHVGKQIYTALEGRELHIWDEVGTFRVMPFAMHEQSMTAAEYADEYIYFKDGHIGYSNPEGQQVGLLIPFFRNANTGLNTTLAIALIAMFFVEFWGIRSLGLFRYAGKFLNFSGFKRGITTGFIDFFVGILEGISEIARVISFTFRLFGNMFAGEILLFVMMFLIPLALVVPFYGLELFVGFIQATIFAVLTLMFAAIAVTAHGDHDDHSEHTEDTAHAEVEAPVAEEAAETTR